MDSINLNSRNTQFEQNEHELDNIMLGTSSMSEEDNKKKYLILGIVLVVLFLLTIIIIRLLTNDPSKDDQFTSNANSSEIKKLSENSNIEENFQKIINERVKKDINEPMIPENAIPADQRLQNVQATNDGTTQGETTQEEQSSNISNETLDETMKKIDQKKASVQKEKTTTSQTTEKKTATKEVSQNTEQKKSVKDLLDSPSESSSSSTVSTSVSSGYFVQIGAFTKKPTDSYINTIRNAKFKYKVYQQEIKGVTYNKVLIGPYSSKAAASESVEDIKQKLNVTSAFVVKF